MSHHALTLLALADDLTLAVMVGWWTAAEFRWHRRCARAATTSRQRAQQPHGPGHPDGNPMSHRNARHTSPHDKSRAAPLWRR